MADVAAPQIDYTTIDLPSRGKLYQQDGLDLVPGGFVQIRKLRVQEDATIFRPGGSILDKLSKVIGSCCKLPSVPEDVNFGHDDLLLTDRLYILIALRTLTFGPHYEFTFRCQTCGTQGRTNVDIVSELTVKPGGVLADPSDLTSHEDLSEPVEIDLPDAHARASFRFLRGTDERKLVAHTKRMRMQSQDGGDPSMLYRYSLMLTHWNGEPITQILEAEKHVRTWTAVDVAKVRTIMDDAESGIDLTVFPECGACGAQSEMEMPFDAEFFRPRVR